MLYCFDDYVLDTERRELRRGPSAVPVEPLIFDLLVVLIANRERVVSKDDLRVAVWDGRIVSESTLGSSINAARTAIGDNGDAQRLIRTLARKGFRFVGPVREQQASAAPDTAAGSSVDRPVFDEPATGGPGAIASQRRSMPVSRTTFMISTAAALAAIAAIFAFTLWRTSDPLPRASTVPSGQRFDASLVPLVEDETRRSLASYPNRPDFKALAITGGGNEVVDGQPNAEAATQEALRRCNARSMRQCRLYAVGMDVVWSKETIPLPAPEDLRFEPLEAPLVPEEIPTIDLKRQETLKVHMKAPDNRALALTTGGAWPQSGRGTRAEAARLALERCAEYWQRPCLLLSVNGRLTIQIPKSRQVVRIFLPSTEAEITGQDKERIGRIYQGAEWRALARGKNGSWHAVAAAPSEAGAIEAALKSCSQVDPDCRLYAIGNFRVRDE